MILLNNLIRNDYIMLNDVQILLSIFQRMKLIKFKMFGEKIKYLLAQLNILLTTYIKMRTNITSHRSHDRLAFIIIIIIKKN